MKAIKNNNNRYLSLPSNFKMFIEKKQKKKNKKQSNDRKNNLEA